MSMPGPLESLFLVVDDIEVARDQLAASVEEIWRIEPGKGQVAGLDPQRRSYFGRATLADPDGNTWVPQVMTERLPGRA